MSNLDPNRYACAQEAAVVQSILAADEDALEVLARRAQTAQAEFSQAEAIFLAAQAAFATANAALVESRARHAGLKEDMRRRRGLLHPVRKLPDDILTMVFDVAVKRTCQFVDFGPMVPEQTHLLVFRLAAVCRHWRTVALSMRSIWRFVYLKLPGGDGAANGAAAALHALKLSVTRSGPHPLHIAIELAENVAQDRHYAVFFQYLRARLICDTKSLFVRAHDSYHDFRTGHLCNFFPHRTMALEELDICTDHCSDRVDEFTAEQLSFPDCPELKSVTLGNLQTRLFAVDAHAAPKVRAGHFWANGAMYLEDLLASLSLYPFLRKLKIEVGSIDTDGTVLASGNNHVTLKRLRELEFQIYGEAVCLEMARALRMPALEKATIFTDGASVFVQQRIHVANFIEHALAHVSHLQLESVALDRITSPAVYGLARLESLEMSACSLEDDALFEMGAIHTTCFRALKKLSIVEAGTGVEFTSHSLLTFVRARRAKGGELTRPTTDQPPYLERVDVSWEPTFMASKDFLSAWDEDFQTALGNA